MSRTTDILVVGSGMAGLVAALAARAQGKEVTLLTNGAGSLSIGSSCIDVLGYVNGSLVKGNPLNAITSLPSHHPYQLLGKKSVSAALDFVASLCSSYGYPLEAPTNGRLRRVPSLVGTLKPTWLCPPSAKGEALLDAKRVTVVSVQGLKDCHPAIICRQLRRYAELSHIEEWKEAILETPFPNSHRNMSALDLARYVASPEGENWLIRGLLPLAEKTDCLLLPPICGMQAQHWQEIHRRLGIPVIEMLSLPPAVSGLRLRSVLLEALADRGIRLIEKATVTRAILEGQRCIALVVDTANGEKLFHAKAMIIATGGLLGGGVITEPNSVKEALFGLPLCTAEGDIMPAHIEEWSDPAIFGKHCFASAGVKVNETLAPVNSSGNPYFENVFFAGRSLCGYDFASEKSGNGVAIATGWKAAQSACAQEV